MFRASRSPFPAVAAVSFAVILAACGSTAATASPTAPPSPAPSSAPSAAPTDSPVPSPSTAAAPVQLLEVHGEGGFINPAATIGSLPTIVVDADGRIYEQGTSTSATIPLITPVEVRDVGAAGAAQILAAMKAAGLDKASTGGVAADAGTTVYTATIDGATVVSRFAAGGGPGPVNHGGGTGGDSGGPGAAALALLTQLQDPTVTWGGASAPATAFAPTAYRIYTAPGAPADAANGGAPVAWPLATALADFGAPAAASFGVAGLRTGIVSGADAATLATALAAASPSTAITSGGSSFTIWVRPLLPDELGS